LDALIRLAHARGSRGAASRTPAATGRAAGFTLVEILVVLAIVGVMVLAVGLSVDSGGPARKATVEAERLVALMRLACDESGQFAQEIGIRFDGSGYVFVRAIGREWEVRDSAALRARRLPAGMRLDLRIGDRAIELEQAGDFDAAAATGGDAGDADLDPHLACDADGALNAGDARIEIRAGDRIVAIRTGEGGALEIEQAGAPP
jgi:type II secretion system protein H